MFCFSSSRVFRFIVIVFPMRSRSVCTLSNCRKAICCVWVIAVVLSLPVMLTKVSVSTQKKTYSYFIFFLGIAQSNNKHIVFTHQCSSAVVAHFTSLHLTCFHILLPICKDSQPITVTVNNKHKEQERIALE